MSPSGRKQTFKSSIVSAIERPLLVKPDAQGLSREASISRGGFTPDTGHSAIIGAKVS